MNVMRVSVELLLTVQLGSVLVVIDGLRMPELDHDHEALVQGDGHCHAIAAASLIAKVARDRLMRALAERRPGYGWQTNVGYATQAHIAALRVHGRTPHHRELFCDTAMETAMGREPVG